MFTIWQKKYFWPVLQIEDINRDDATGREGTTSSICEESNEISACD